MSRNRIAFLLLALALSWALVDRDSGLPRWWRLDRDLEAAEARVDVLREEVERLEREALALRDDRFAQERAIREDLGLARPGETVVRVELDEEAAARRP